MATKAASQLVKFSISKANPKVGIITLNSPSTLNACKYVWSAPSRWWWFDPPWLRIRIRTRGRNENAAHQGCFLRSSSLHIAAHSTRLPPPLTPVLFVLLS